MNHSLLVAYCVTANVAVMAAVLALIAAGLQRTQVSASTRARTWMATAAVLAAWYAAISVLGVRGVFSRSVGSIPLLPFGIVPPILIGFWLFLRSQALRATATAIPAWWLVSIQAYRVIGVAFLFVAASGEMPAPAAISAGIGDVLVGLLVLPVALALYRGSPNARLMAYGWNILGIVDFLTAIATGFLSAPGPMQRIALDHPNTMISLYPMVLFPLFAIPLSSVLHGICLFRLTTSRAAPPGYSHPRQAASTMMRLSG